VYLITRPGPFPTLVPTDRAQGVDVRMMYESAWPWSNLQRIYKMWSCCTKTSAVTPHSFNESCQYCCPINLSLDRDNHLSPFDPSFQVIPNIIGRLKSLSVYGTPENLQLITAHLSQPAPHLERLSIHGGCNQASPHSPTLTPTLFNGDLSSLRKLCLEYICTELPWRNMINLTSFILTHTTLDGVSITQFLNFFESAPNLRTINLYSAAPTSGI